MELSRWFSGIQVFRVLGFLGLKISRKPRWHVNNGQGPMKGKPRISEQAKLGLNSRGLDPGHVIGGPLCPGGRATLYHCSSQQALAEVPTRSALKPSLPVPQPTSLQNAPPNLTNCEILIPKQMSRQAATSCARRAFRSCAADPGAA